MALPAIIGGISGGAGILSNLVGGLQTSKNEILAKQKLKEQARGQGTAAGMESANARRRAAAIGTAQGQSAIQQQFAQNDVSRQFAPAISREAQAANAQLLATGQKDTSRTQKLLGGLGGALGALGAQSLRTPAEAEKQDTSGAGLLGRAKTVAPLGNQLTDNDRARQPQAPSGGLSAPTEDALGAIGLPKGGGGILGSLLGGGSSDVTGELNFDTTPLTPEELAEMRRLEALPTPRNPFNATNFLPSGNRGGFGL